MKETIVSGCSCGRNLDYPKSRDGDVIICRCGKKHHLLPLKK